MKRVILFRFHKSLPVCRNRITLLKKYNPAVEIYGLFGGQRNLFIQAKKILGNDLSHIYFIEGKTSMWKWKNGDLAVKLWYRDFGREIKFDLLHLVEWDLLLFSSLNKLYPIPSRMAVAITGLKRLSKVQHFWSWFRRKDWYNQWRELMKLVRDKYNYNKKPYACMAGGTCLSRDFLEELSLVDIPDLCHDEIRIPLYAQIFGMKLYDTGFIRSWTDKKEQKFFNFGKDVKFADIEKELIPPAGRRVFHPYSKSLPREYTGILPGTHLAISGI